MRRPEVTWTHPGIARIVDLLPLEGQSLLDVGCGRGIVGALCRIYRAYSRQVGLDIYGPYLEFCGRYRFYDELLEWNLEQLPLPFRGGEFDVATAVEVIEHLDKTKGIALLEELSRVARTVIVTTPNRFFVQRAYDGNEWQQHRSRWSASDFKKIGYRVFGCGGLLIGGRWIRGVSRLGEGLSRYCPAWAEFLLCVKSSS